MTQLAFEIKNQLFLGNKYIKDSPYETGGLFPVIWVIIKNIYVFTGIILFFFIIAGAIGMILNAGNAEKQKQSSKTISSAVFGYLIMFAAYWLVKIIQTVLGVKLLL